MDCCEKVPGAHSGQEGRPQGREFRVVSSDHCGLPARVAGNVWIVEILRCGRRGKRDDQSNGENDFLHGYSPLRERWDGN